MKSHKHNSLRTLLALSICLFIFVVPVDTARAEDPLTVTTFVDEFDGTCDAHCSLRDAIYAANFFPEASTIILPAGTYALTRVGYDNTGLAGDLDILAPTTIIGMEAGLTFIDAKAVGHRIFDILNGAVILAT